MSPFLMLKESIAHEKGYKKLDLEMIPNLLALDLDTHRPKNVP